MGKVIKRILATFSFDETRIEYGVPWLSAPCQRHGTKLAMLANFPFVLLGYNVIRDVSLAAVGIKETCLSANSLAKGLDAALQSRAQVRVSWLVECGCRAESRPLSSSSTTSSASSSSSSGSGLTQSAKQDQQTWWKSQERG